MGKKASFSCQVKQKEADKTQCDSKKTNLQQPGRKGNVLHLMENTVKPYI